MGTRNILHMISPTKHVSPFDVNMALDAGFDNVVPYDEVTADEVVPLIQDAMFSRAPDDAKRTGAFLGGKDALLALDMLDAARGAMFPPFQFSVFADPAGSFTTAAAMVACALKALAAQSLSLDGLRVAVYGGTGVVGFASGVIAGLEGADVQLVGYDGPDRVRAAADQANARFGVTIGFADGSNDDKNTAIAAEADVIFAAGRAGVQILDEAQLGAAGKLKVAADVNAVPPSGIAGIDAQSDGAPIAGTSATGIGPFAVGNIKYKTQAGLFRRMIEEDEPLFLDFRDAFTLAKDLAG